MLWVALLSFTLFEPVGPPGIGVAFATAPQCREGLVVNRRPPLIQRAPARRIRGARNHHTKPPYTE